MHRPPTILPPSQQGNASHLTAPHVAAVLPPFYHAQALHFPARYPARAACTATPLANAAKRCRPARIGRRGRMGCGTWREWR